MKKLLFETLGKAQEVLKIAESDMPALKKGEVCVQVKNSPINPSDVMFVQGLYGIRPQLPSGIGFEGAGLVESVGEGVSVAVGTRVSFIGLGAFAEYAVAPASMLMPLADGLSFEVGCQSFVNPLTAWAMLHDSGLQAGDWLLLTAGGSTFGQLVIQLAAQRGINTVATVRRNDQIEQLKKLGVSQVVNTVENNLYKAVKEMTAGKGVNCCFDAVGGDLATQAINCLGFGGKMFVFGMLGLQETQMNNGTMLFKSLTIKGFWLSEWLPRIDKTTRQQAFGEVAKMIANGSLLLKTDGIYSLEQFKDAFDHEAKEGRTGKILFKM